MLGVITANLLAFFLLRRTKQDGNDFIVLEAYGILGGFVGAKLLYLIVSAKEIDWSQITDLKYFNQLMQGGFVFYGGLVGGICVVILAGRLHRIQTRGYITNFIFLVPLIQGFGRVGCFLAGCCYGIPYDGIGAVVFPENSYALPGVKLFPVQLVETVILLIISAVLAFWRYRKNSVHVLELYFILYGIARFVLEFFRYDTIRGQFVGLSTSQWISILLIVIACVILLKNNITFQKKSAQIPQDVVK